MKKDLTNEKFYPIIFLLHAHMKNSNKFLLDAAAHGEMNKHSEKIFKNFSIPIIILYKQILEHYNTVTCVNADEVEIPKYQQELNFFISTIKPSIEKIVKQGYEDYLNISDHVDGTLIVHFTKDLNKLSKKIEEELTTEKEKYTDVTDNSGNIWAICVEYEGDNYCEIMLPNSAIKVSDINPKKAIERITDLLSDGRKVYKYSYPKVIEFIQELDLIPLDFLPTMSASPKAYPVLIKL